MAQHKELVGCVQHAGIGGIQRFDIGQEKGTVGVLSAEEQNEEKHDMSRRSK